MILTAGTGCDNVAWGGFDWELRSPPAAPPQEDAEGPAEPPPPAVLGPLLLAGERTDARATLVVVGEVRGDSLAPPPDTSSTPELHDQLLDLTELGSRWILFSEGVRVGSLVVDQVRASEEYCPARTSVSGVVELVPGASEAQRLLALPPGWATDREYDEFERVQHVFDQRVANLNYASAAVPRFEAPYPPDGLVDARQDVQAFHLLDQPTPSIAATYLYRDQLAIAPPGQGAYALFVMATGAGQQFTESFTWFRAVDTEGKGAPRYFNHLDLNGDGDSEILLDVFGAGRRWFASLAPRDGQWVRTFQDSCAGPSAGS